MKSLLLAGLFISAPIMATPGYLSDYNYQLTDFAVAGINKEEVFKKMERKMISLENSICSNRAHLWAYDMYRSTGANTGKIFVFFGKSIWEGDKKNGWMYHVAPYIIENGKEFVMEAGYSDVVKPLTIDEWVANETYGRVRGSECLEITAEDKDLTEYFYNRVNLPERRGNGLPSARCYYRKVPAYYWFPMSIATRDFGKDVRGRSVDFDPTEFNTEEVLNACVEAASGKVGRVFGGGKNKCKKYLGME